MEGRVNLFSLAKICMVIKTKMGNGGGEYMGDINLPPNHYEKCQVNENAGGEILYLNIMNKSDI